MFTRVFYTLFSLITLVSVSCSVFEEQEDHSKFLLEHRGVFKADIDGDQWVAKKITINYNKETNSMRVGAGQESDTTMSIFIEDIKEQYYKRDTANPAQSAHWQMLRLNIEGLEIQDNIDSQPWETGYLEVLSLTTDSLEAQFEFTTEFNEVKNGYAKLYIGEN